MIYLCTIWFDHYLLKAWRRRKHEDSAAWLIISCVYALEIGHMLQSEHIVNSTAWNRDKQRMTHTSFSQAEQVQVTMHQISV